jgi:hypothetical protein
MAKQAMKNTLQQLLLAIQEDGKAGSPTHTSTHAVDTFDKHKLQGAKFSLPLVGTILI